MITTAAAARRAVFLAAFVNYSRISTRSLPANGPGCVHVEWGPARGTAAHLVRVGCRIPDSGRDEEPPRKPRFLIRHQRLDGTENRIPRVKKSLAPLVEKLTRRTA